MKISTLIFIFLLGLSACSAQENLDLDVQISQAILALPESFRDEAKVLGYNNATELTVIREGNNDMICLADDPQKDGFKVVGYHKGLDPFMQLGRTLKKEGKSAKEIFELRGKEVKSGNINIREGSLLYVVSGQYNDQNQPIDLYQRFVVYMPYATVETTGLTLTPSYPGGPWIMDPGTHRAHIMINPTRVEEKE